jgi:hypothetical protein
MIVPPAVDQVLNAHAARFDGVLASWPDLPAAALTRLNMREPLR